MKAKNFTMGRNLLSSSVQKQFKLIITCTCFFTFLLNANAQYYTLQDDDVVVTNGMIDSCFYDTTGNSKDIIIPETLDGQTIIGISDGEEDFFFNVYGPFAGMGIQKVQLPATLKYLGDYAFYENILDTIIIPDGVTSIGFSAFYSNNIQNEVIIPNTVKTIGMNAFNDNQMDTVVFADNSQLVNIGSHAFANNNVGFSMVLPTPVVDDFKYWICMDGSGTTYNGGDAVYPGNYAFIAKFTYTLTDNDVAVIDGSIDSCYYDFSGKFIVIPDTLDGQAITSIADAAAQKKGLFYGKGIMAITLPATLESIGDMAFNMNSIDTLFIPKNVTTIGDNSFWGAINDTVIFEDSCKLETIGFSAFDNNTGLQIVLPVPVKEGYVLDKWRNGSGALFNGGDTISVFNTTYTANFIHAPGTKIIELDGDLTFDDVYVDSSSTLILTIESTGNDTLKISSIDLPEGFSANWTSGNVVDSSSQEIEITFTPSEAKEYSGYIKINSDALMGVDSIEVSGTGVPWVSVSKILSKLLLQAYPNPVLDILTVQSDQNVIVQLISINGEILFEKECDGKLSINMTQYTSGVYILRAKNQQGSYKNSIIIKE